MLLKDDIKLVKYAKEYITYGVHLQYFDKNTASIFYQNLLNLKVIHNNNLPGDARIINDTLEINDIYTFTNEKNASLILFHEFSHYCNNIHSDIFNTNGNLYKLKGNVNNIMNTNYQYNNSSTRMGDILNPYTYILYGGLLLDEVTSQYIATRMNNLKFDEPMDRYRYERRLGNHYIDFVSNFKYYGIGQYLVDEFSKTLFVKNEDKNINGLCKQIFDKNFMKQLIYQHNERPSAMQSLCTELGFMGVVAWYEEEKNGRCKGEHIPEDFVYHSYQQAKQVIRSGYEDRENIPGNIRYPSFL